MVGFTGWFVDELALICDDAESSVIGPPVKKETKSETCSGGFISTMVISGDFVGQVTSYCPSSRSYLTKGEALGQGSGGTGISFTLMSDQRIIGMQMYHGVYVRGISFLYSATSPWRQTISPVLYPTITPTRKPTASNETMVKSKKKQ